MSNPRFAPVTSDLLARKGDAVPSTLAAKPSLFWRRAAAAPLATPATPPPVTDLRHAPAPARAPVEAARPPVEPAQAVAEPPLALDASRVHKIMVALTPTEYEKLGIAAVKKGLTRHQIVRTALDLHLERLKREYGGCGCMAMGEGACSSGCGT